jgi:hypothetical protein
VRSVPLAMATPHPTMDSISMSFSPSPNAITWIQPDQCSQLDLEFSNTLFQTLCYQLPSQQQIQRHVLVVKYLNRGARQNTSERC